MKDLENALNIRRKYNDMPFDDFVKELQDYIGRTIPIKDIENFRYTGLNNVDLFRAWYHIPQ